MTRARDRVAGWHPAAGERGGDAVGSSVARGARGCVSVLLLACGLLAIGPGSASGAFEYEVHASASDAVCGAGPSAGLISLLTARPAEAVWSLQFVTGELHGLPELQASSMTARRRTADHSLALRASSFGCELYRERTLSLVAGRRWTEHVAAEIEGRALCMSWRGGESAWAGAADASAAWLVQGRLALGLSIRNVTSAKILTSEVCSSVSGDAALLLDGVTFLASVHGEPGFEPSVGVGCELMLCHWARLRAGFRTAPAMAATGLLLDTGAPLRPAIGLACVWHPVLGSSCSLTVSIRL